MLKNEQPIQSGRKLNGGQGSVYSGNGSILTGVWRTGNVSPSSAVRHIDLQSEDGQKLAVEVAERYGVSLPKVPGE